MTYPYCWRIFCISITGKQEKKISGVSDKVLKNMMAYSWPGNIRELEHLIEKKRAAGQR